VVIADAPLQRWSESGSIAVMASSLPIVALSIDVLLYLNRLDKWGDGLIWAIYLS
jgi:hypothetical protein